MTTIDPSTNLGRLRLRCADFSDTPMLPDSVYAQALIDTTGDLPRAAIQCAKYILGTLAFKTHRKIGLQLEVWNDSQFKNYKEYLMLTIKDPAFMDISPIPFSASGLIIDPLIEFQQSWNKNYYRGTQSQSLSLYADISPNDGSRLGPLSGNGSWIDPITQISL